MTKDTPVTQGEAASALVTAPSDELSAILQRWIEAPDWPGFYNAEYMRGTLSKVIAALSTQSPTAQKPGYSEFDKLVAEVLGVQAPAPSNEQIDAVLAEVDRVAREYDHYEYGLPLHSPDDDVSPIHKMRAAVRSLYAAPSSLPVQPEEGTTHGVRVPDGGQQG